MAPTRIAVYRNLNREKQGLPDSWSICEISPSGKSRGKLIRHATTVTLANCVPYVSESARQRVIRVGHREVHAWIIGEVLSVDGETLESVDRVTYRPFDGPSFVYAADGKPFTGTGRFSRLDFTADGKVYQC